MIDRHRVVVYAPRWIGGSKLKVLLDIASTCSGMVRDVDDLLRRMEDQNDLIPMLCCAGELRSVFSWCRAHQREWVYWDRGYVRRRGGMWEPVDRSEGYWRLHLSEFQMSRIRRVPGDRWGELHVKLMPWRDGTSGHVLIIDTNSEYWDVMGIEEGWADRTADLLISRGIEVRVRRKRTAIPLISDLQGARCLVAHGSNAAVEAAILGVPVFVDETSAAALVGEADLGKIDTPALPDRTDWANSLAYSQFTTAEILSGYAWSQI